MLNEYADTPQVENILAARAWHLRFPLDEYVAKERVSFQRGRKIEEGELGGGLIWIEVGKSLLRVLLVYGCCSFLDLGCSGGRVLEC
jgi:hypothetical protein